MDANEKLLDAVRIFNTEPALEQEEKKPEADACGLQIVTFDELMKKEFKPLFQPVEGLIIEGYILLVGGSKIGKSWLMLDLAYCVATGRPFLGRATTKCPVLYFALEDSERRIQDRNRKMNLAEAEEPVNINYVLEAQTLDSGFYQQADAWLTANGGRCLVIVDVLQKIRGRSRYSDGDAYQADYRTTNPILELARKHSAAIICVHHTNKEHNGRDKFGRISGSTGLMGAADETILIDRERGENTADVSITGREVREESFEIRMDENFHWHAITPEAAARERYEANPIVKPLRDLFKDYPNGGRISYGEFIARSCGRFPYRDAREFSRKLSGGLAEELRLYDGIIIETGVQMGKGKDHTKGFAFRKDTLYTV